jgi:hypothetical protein
MAKKLLADAAASKLAQPHEARSEPPRLVAPRKTIYQPKSFRLGPVHLDRLRRVAERLSEAAGRPISETETLKGLLLLGEKTDARKLLATVKDAVFEGY